MVHAPAGSVVAYLSDPENAFVPPTPPVEVVANGDGTWRAQYELPMIGLRVARVLATVELLEVGPQRIRTRFHQVGLLGESMTTVAVEGNATRWTKVTTTKSTFPVVGAITGAMTRRFRQVVAEQGVLATKARMEAVAPPDVRPALLDLQRATIRANLVLLTAGVAVAVAVASGLAVSNINASPALAGIAATLLLAMGVMKLRFVRGPWPVGGAGDMGQFHRLEWADLLLWLLIFAMAALSASLTVMALRRQLDGFLVFITVYVWGLTAFLFGRVLWALRRRWTLVRPIFASPVPAAPSQNRPE